MGKTSNSKGITPNKAQRRPGATQPSPVKAIKAPIKPTYRPQSR